MFLQRCAIRIVFSAFILVTIIFAGPSSHATLFSNSYVSFELPPNWECKLEGTEWVCVNQYSKQSKEAIIILTAKEAGPTDTVEGFKKHLSTPYQAPDKTGKLTPSKVYPLKERLIAGHTWVDSMHYGSQVTSYYTRYLATIKDRLVIVVTFSAHKDHYTKYSEDFLRAIESIRVVAGKDILDTKPQMASGGSTETIGAPIGLPELNSAPPTEPTPGDLKTKLIAIALLLLAIGFYLWQKKRK